MCGPSSDEKGIQADTEAFGNLLQSNYSQQFGEQQGVLNQINKSLSPIVAAGPSQNGFSGSEVNTLQTAAVNNAGAANTAAQQAARTYGAGQGGGGTSGLTSGITKQIQGAIAGQGAGNLATNENQIGLANEQQGNQNFRFAEGGMQALAQGYSPNASMSGAESAQNSAFGEASQITQENNAEAKDIAGFATAAIGSAGDIVSAFKQ